MNHFSPYVHVLSLQAAKYSIPLALVKTLPVNDVHQPCTKSKGQYQFQRKALWWADRSTKLYGRLGFVASKLGGKSSEIPRFFPANLRCPCAPENQQIQLPEVWEPGLGTLWVTPKLMTVRTVLKMNKHNQSIYSSQRVLKFAPYPILACIVGMGSKTYYPDYPLPLCFTPNSW